MGQTNKSDLVETLADECDLPVKETCWIVEAMLPLALISTG